MAPSQPMPLPEPMNATPHHSKVKVSITLADPIFVAGDYVAGKMELECRADKGLGVGVILVELFAIQELNSRDHSATSTFLHSRRLFQGPGLPPSNAVHAHPQPGYPVLPPTYYQARRGLSTFLFRIPIPETSPSSIIFGSGLGRVRYELRASVGVVWKGERRLVIDTQSLDVVSAFPHELIGVKEPEAVIIGENGKLWMQGKLVGPVIIAGESACIELQVKNHSNKKNTGLSLSLNRTLVLPGSIGVGKQAMELTDTLTHVPFRGAEYIIPPGAEGVAHLVFDVPKQSRGVRGGILDGDDTDPPRSTESLFEIRCSVDVKMSMGFGNKDLVLSIPVTIVHPRAVPPNLPLHSQPMPVIPYPPPQNVYANVAPVYPPPHPMTPPVHSLPPFLVDHQQNQVWLPPPTPIPFQGYAAYSPQHHPHQYLVSPAPQAVLVPPSHYGPCIARPVSAGGNVSVPDPYMLPASGLPLTYTGNAAVNGLPSPTGAGNTSIHMDAEEGKGQRASRIAHHLRMSSRTRSVSPQSHRFPLGAPVIDSFEPSTPLQDPVSGRLRQLPQPPRTSSEVALDRVANLSLSPPQRHVHTMVHSPRPQLTPKHSFYNERPKSERVEVLERMADVVAAQLNDLSGDIPKDDVIHAAMPGPDGKDKSKEAELNKTLPAPPVPSQKPTAVASPPTRAPLDSLFEDPKPKSAPLLEPSDKAPPTPTLTAILPKRVPRSNINDFLAPDNRESGLDALERRLLAEVGTRKFDEMNPHKGDDKRPGIRDIMGVGPIDIPVKAKSPEPLNDSAISSLTLANDHRSADGDNDAAAEQDDKADSDLDVEAKTHRGARSRSVSGDERGKTMKRVPVEKVHLEDDALWGVRSIHRREEADTAPAASTPTKLSAGSGKSKDKDREKKASGRKKDRATKEERARTKTEAKGRVAAWLGGIVPDEPPQEESIPPSPSIARRPDSVLREAKSTELLPNEDNGKAFAGLPSPTLPPVSAGQDGALKEKDVSSAPNPRSSGFMPMHTLKRQQPVIEREMAAVEEAKKVADIWGESLGTNDRTPVPPSKPALPPKPLVSLPPKVVPQSVRTDRRVSPPSRKPEFASDKSIARDESKPLNDVAPRNGWKLPDPTPAVNTAATTKAKATSPPPPPAKPTNINVTRKPSARLPQFPPLPARKPDPEVSYDVRSARGGRGGQVTSVAALWASVAANNGAASGPPIKPKPDALGGKRLSSDPSRKPASTTGQQPPRLPGKIALPGLAKADSSASTDAKSPPVLKRQVSAPKPTVPSDEPSSKAGPIPVSKVASSSAVKVESSSGGPTIPSRSKSTEFTRNPPTRGLFTGDLKSRTPGKTTPNNLSTPSAGGSSEPRLLVAAVGGAGPKTNAKPIIKSTSVPAVISSSHAVPVLSSTASLARPAATPRLTAGVANRSPDKPKTDRTAVIPSIVTAKLGSVPAPSHSSSAAPKSPPPDLAFGQARLRDLIKKYQSQAT
ncbi:hypothetical protein CC1G_06251 [Coprinopsis cinerea okayama7|uniref:Arrestin-like N-terminal domain-containing protein n=1 Tax=Coprinopsis cinerea (strain Okayama-7 / 130 / ATCC MYA-4618 / FGSC 9003) TaxID=240176 RepID=A8NVD7_COPC7|nr:hypothetical protein CC1G_06251 [Coprinopsis cinerea okayama7\|eukprot:XP_001836664.1 hypothetical protein CC1G_06251 [Coprinopsis cinerea okayama7\